MIDQAYLYLYIANIEYRTRNFQPQKVLNTSKNIFLLRYSTVPCSAVLRFRIDDAWFYYKKQKNEIPLREIIQPIESICSQIPKIYIRDSAVDAICHGASLAIPGIIQISKNIDKNSLVAIMTMKGELVALARSLFTSKKISKQENGLCARPVAVFMKKGIYPSSWKSV